MVKQLIIGLACEGPTDQRFLSSIIKRTYENLVLQHTTNVEILDIQIINVKKSAFIEYARNACYEGANKLGTLVICLHADADSADDNQTFESKINPALAHIANQDDSICKVIAPLVPVRMTEAWMLADEQCFIDEIGTSKSLCQLGIPKHLHTLVDPKAAIVDAIAIAFEDKPARRVKPKISDLYLPLGQKLDLGELDRLKSYRKFKEAVRKTLEQLDYINTV